MKVGLAVTAFNGVSALVAGLLAASPLVGIGVFLGLPVILCTFAFKWTELVLRHGQVTGRRASIRGVLEYLDGTDAAPVEAPVVQLRLFQE
jgi:hypothetical protein